MNEPLHQLSNWVTEFTEELYSWAFYKVSDKELAKDLVQDTFLAAAEKINGFKGESSPKTWLFSILNYKIIEIYRKKVSVPVSSESSAFTDFFNDEGNWLESKRPKSWTDHEAELLDDADFRFVLSKCLDALPQRWNVCINLKYLSDKSGDDICQEIGITPTNFWQIIRRAKLQLRECVERNWFQN